MLNNVSLVIYTLLAAASLTSGVYIGFKAHDESQKSMESGGMARLVELLMLLAVLMVLSLLFGTTAYVLYN